MAWDRNARQKVFTSFVLYVLITCFTRTCRSVLPYGARVKVPLRKVRETQARLNAESCAPGEPLKCGKVLVNNGNNDNGGGKVRATRTWLDYVPYLLLFSLSQKLEMHFLHFSLFSLPARMKIPKRDEREGCRLQSHGFYRNLFFHIIHTLYLEKERERQWMILWHFFRKIYHWIL